MRRILPTAIWAESQKLPTGCPMWNLLTVSRVTHSASSMPSNFSQLACRMRPRLPSGGYLALKSEPSTSASAAASGIPSSPVTWIREHTPFNPLFLLPQMSFPCLTPAHPSKSQFTLPPPWAFSSKIHSFHSSVYITNNKSDPIFFGATVV